MNHFELIVKKVQTHIDIILHGVINEQAEFPEVKLGDFQSLGIDFHGVEHINSIGIQKWTLFMNAIGLVPGLKISFEGCPQAIVQQMNTVRDFLPARVTVNSCFVPFFCENCTNSAQIIFRRGREIVEAAGTTSIRTPEVACSQCRSRMEADILPHKYFNFLLGRKAAL